MAWLGRTPYVFKLHGGCRLCERCERSNPAKYGVVELSLACTMHALSERDLDGIASYVVGNTNAGRHQKQSGPRLLLRSDVEACAVRVHRGRQGGEAAAHHRAAAAAWRKNSFKPDARNNGKTHKWKASMKGPTFHAQELFRKRQHVDTSQDAAACVGLSALTFVGYPDCRNPNTVRC